MVNHKWIHLTFEPDVLSGDDNHFYEIVVFVDENEQFYFFGNAVLWILGYDKPHETLQNLVPSDKRHRVRFGSGIFLDESTVRGLINNRLKEKLKFRTFKRVKNFETWLENYLVNCKGKNPGRTCPY